MESELEDLIDVCRQVTRWADAPTPKGDFPKQFVDRLLVALRDLPEMTDCLNMVYENEPKGGQK
jgi:hypothetical protein